MSDADNPELSFSSDWAWSLWLFFSLVDKFSGYRTGQQSGFFSCLNIPLEEKIVRWKTGG